ncbi:HNH endonuclease signature motif containing protein [Demetria terragena]|uniref:HNH endonuclease signature motif containing protein n=1 Tax=Demetria terragena TaxID=63959 RepID=UPI0003814541|nr:HNH endonuclease signature motif containing protein [Demetria terragena]
MNAHSSPPADVGTELVMSAAECARLVLDGLAGLATVDTVRHQLGTRDLAIFTRNVLAVLQIAETAAVALVAEAIQRGVVVESTAAGAAQWVSRLSTGEAIEGLLPSTSPGTAGPLVRLDGAPECPVAEDTDPSEGGAPTLPGVELAVATRIAKVASACTEPRNELLATALATNHVGVAGARTALIEVDKVMPVLPEGTRDAVLGHFLSLPAGSGARAIRELSGRVIATYADETFLEDLDDKLDAAESVTWSELPNGMHRLTAELGPLHAAQVKHAIDALSAPAIGSTCCDDVFHRHAGGEKTGEIDARTAGKRRADGFVLLVTRGSAAIDDDGATPTSGPARIVVTIDHDVLAGRLRGHGRTDVGTSLGAHQVRRIACDADILPMVLGSRGEPLDVGRSKRLVTRSLRAAVAERDRCCTYPGCDRPPSWCQVHHIVPWSEGGPTSLDNSALLCQRHHTVVHREEYTAKADAVGVTWDLRPGSMRHHAAEDAA